MKDYTSKISQARADLIVNYLIDHEYPVECVEGALVDDYLVDVGENNLRLGNVKIRKYLIIIGEYLNEWSSALKLILTDDEEVFENYCNLLL